MSDPLDTALGVDLRREADSFTSSSPAVLTESTLVQLVRRRRIRRRRRAWSVAVAGLSAAAVVFVVLTLASTPRSGSYTADPPGTVGPGTRVSPGPVVTVTRRGAPTASPTTTTSPSTVALAPTQVPASRSGARPPVARTTPVSASPPARPASTVLPPASTPSSTVAPPSPSTSTPSSTVAPPSTSTTLPPGFTLRPRRANFVFKSSDSGRTFTVPVGSEIEVKLAGCPGNSPPVPGSSNSLVVEPQGSRPPSSNGERVAFYLAARVGKSSLNSPAIPGSCAPVARAFILHIIVARQ